MNPIRKFCYESGKRWEQIVLLPLVLMALVLPACGENQSAPPEQEEGVLTYAILDPLTSMQKRRILSFNNSHPDVQIEVLDYSDDGGVDRLLTELLLGKVPDIMELRRRGDDSSVLYYWMGGKERAEGEYWLPYRQMAHKGYLEDLWPYIENDPELGREMVLEAPLKAAEVDGGLYMLFKHVTVNTLIGEESVVGERDGWTLEELMEAYSTMPDGSTILRYNATRWEMYSNLFCTTLDRYIDWETGQCSFDNDEFRDMLEFLRTFPTEFKTALTPVEMQKELVWRRLDGEQMLESVNVYRMMTITMLDTVFGRDRVAFVGYPTTDGSSGSFFNIRGTTLAMASTCQNKEAAWKFMSYLIRPVYSVSAMNEARWDASIMIPINRKSYENGITADFRLPRKQISPMPTYPGGPDFEVDPPTDDDLRRYEKLLNSTTQLYWPDDALSKIVWDTSGAYFAGDRTLDDTIRLIENRVGLYINEQR